MQITPEARLAFCHVLEPWAPVGKPPKYSVTLIIPKNQQADFEAFSAVMQDGDDTTFPELKGSYYIKTSSKYRPEVVDAELNPVSSTSEVYSGCYGQAALELYEWTNNGTQGHSAMLVCLQVTRKGTRLDGKKSAREIFNVQK